MATERKDLGEVREVNEEEMRQVCGGRDKDVDWGDQQVSIRPKSPYSGNE